MKPSKTVGAVCAAGALATPLISLSPASAATPVEFHPVTSERAPGLLAEIHDAGMDLALDRHVRIARSHARVRGERLSRPERRHLRRQLDDLRAREVRQRTRELRRKTRKLRHRVERAGAGAAAAGPSVAVPGHLQAIAACESGGDPSAVDPSGTYRGKYQFDQGTWASVGGSGDPAAAPEAEQDRRAAMLYDQAGAGRWPVCGG
jgi:uncharacterized membrane protein